MKGMLAVVVVTLVLTSCATVSERREGELVHSALDAMTEVIDPLYQAVELGCDAAERVIVLRAPLSKDEEEAQRIDQTDLQAIRTACNPVIAAFEEVRVQQLEARTKAEAIKNGNDVPVSRALDALATLHTASANAYAAWKKAKATLKELLHVGAH